ncbi:MAG: GNAT family N-acetyltransferase [Rubrivivax sp.]|jgi:putative acetyltransferase|nr:GNAT family N-acetyltransferase [Rubrivivax sp.]
MNIRIDDLQGPEIRALLEEHLRHMHSLSPPESVHALDLTGLQRPEVTFWTAWTQAEGGELMGCGALKQIGPLHGEIKSMRTAEAFRGQGVARAMLGLIVQTARERGWQRLSLETGAEPGFEAARKLYEAFGFGYCGPFEGYREDPNSVFMTRTLD